VVFFLVFTPAGLLARLFGHALSRSRRPPAAGTAARRKRAVTWIAILRRSHMGQSGIARELWRYMKVRKKWWLLPIILILALVGGLLVFAQGSVLAPFIYTIF
jgi:hypothetical protein